MTLPVDQAGEIERYAWKEGAHIRVAPAVAGTEFATIYNAHQQLTPALVVARAEHADSALHDHFEWDDAKAGAAHRESQARHLITCLVVVYRKTDSELTPPTREWVKIKPSPGVSEVDETTALAEQPNVYIPVVQVMNEEALRRRYLQQALRDMLAVRRRYQDLTEFASVFAVIDEVLAQHNG